MTQLLLMNPNGSQATTDTMVSIARRHLPEVWGWTNLGAPSMITDQPGLEAAAAQVAQADLPEVDAVIVAAFGDPGAGALAKRLSIPVIGIGAAAARAASLGGARFAVATTTPDLAKSIDALMLEKGGTTYAGCFLTEGDPLDLAAKPRMLDAALLKACQAAVGAGAERVIIGGGPLAEAAIRLQRQSPVELIQPLVAACNEVRTAIRTGHSAPRVPDVDQSDH
ncbi:MAG: aspartate/glutamate racemase family protein [Paracoccaceae bacterium]